MHTIIERLRDLCRRFLVDGDSDLRWLGSRLDDFLSHRCRSLEEALGLRFARGGIPWWREEAARKRDAALRTLAQLYCPGERLSVQTKRVYEQAARYAALRWCIDARRKAMPPHYAGTAKEWLWKAFASGAPMPIRERRLRDILQGLETHRQCRRRRDAGTAGPPGDGYPAIRGDLTPADRNDGSFSPRSRISV